MNLSPARVVRNHEAERVGRILGRRLQQRRRQHHDGVGDRQRGEHAAAAHDEAGIGLLLDASGEKRVRLSAKGRRCGSLAAVSANGSARDPPRAAPRASARRCAEARVAGREKLGAGRVGGERAIQVVRHAAHHPVRVAGDDAPSRGRSRRARRPSAAAGTNARPCGRSPASRTGIPRRGATASRKARPASRRRRGTPRAS